MIRRSVLSLLSVKKFVNLLPFQCIVFYFNLISTSAAFSLFLDLSLSLFLALSLSLPVSLSLSLSLSFSLSAEASFDTIYKRYSA